jgi:hypothetical protein
MCVKNTLRYYPPDKQKLRSTQLSLRGSVTIYQSINHIKHQIIYLVFIQRKAEFIPAVIKLIILIINFIHVTLTRSLTAIDLMFSHQIKVYVSLQHSLQLA